MNKVQSKCLINQFNKRNIIKYTMVVIIYAAHLYNDMKCPERYVPITTCEAGIVSTLIKDPKLNAYGNNIKMSTIL